MCVVHLCLCKVLRGARPDITPAMTAECSPAYSQLIMACWDEDPDCRPSALEICEEIHKKCWAHMVHSRIKETTKTVDLKLLSASYENEKSKQSMRAAFTTRPSQLGLRYVFSL